MDCTLVDIDSPVDDISFYHDPKKSCCVCYSDVIIVFNNTLHKDAQLNDVHPHQFPLSEIPDDVMFINPCDEHYLCVRCMRAIIHNYENHPINENNSHFACPNPFDECLTRIGTKHVFDHHVIEKICRTSIEWTNYKSYADQYTFPGYTIMKCPRITSTGVCNTPIPIKTEDIRNAPMGDLIITCSQNENCQSRFCYSCKQSLARYDTYCYNCKLSHENDNPNVFNYYFNKNNTTQIVQTLYDTPYTTLTFQESDYLFLNKDITLDIAIHQLLDTFHNVNTHMICPVCKISLYKTEKCNALKHHGIERCYACSRIGFKASDLGDHWSDMGCRGCFRFDSSPLVASFIPSFVCNESVCSSHSVGDCTDPDHQPGILLLHATRHKAYIYHMIISLLPSIRYQVYDHLFELAKDDPALLEILPYKQSLLIVEYHNESYLDYNEDTLYSNLRCKHPKLVTEIHNKSTIINPSTYITRYTLSPLLSTIDPQDPSNELSAWRMYLQNDLLRITEPVQEQEQDISDTPLTQHTDWLLEPSNTSNTLLTQHTDWLLEPTNTANTLLTQHTDWLLEPTNATNTSGNVVVEYEHYHLLGAYFPDSQ